MNPEIKALWLAALRGGKYKQARGALRKSNGFCCLGVLCDLAVNADLGHWAYDISFTDKENHRTVEYLPHSISDWANLPESDPQINGRYLSFLNDGQKDKGIRPHTFAEIADLIEAHL